MTFYNKNKNYLRLMVPAVFLVLSLISSLRGSLKNPIEVRKVVNMKFPINSSGDDFSPSLTADGKTLLFNSKLKNEEYHNIFKSRFMNGRWTTPEYFEILNSRYDNDETPFISPDGTLIVFSSDRQNHGGRFSSRKMTYNIYFSRKVEGKWTEPEPIPGDVNSKNNERSPCLSPDNMILYFSRWPYKNIRKSKIFRAVFKNGRYTDVMPLPKPINTGNYEITFTPSHLRSGFYFSSRRKKGFGGWDIYFAYYIDGQFTKVVNLGPEINSPGNDLFMTEVGNRLYFSSNRVGGYGKYDIYFANIRKINIPGISEIYPDNSSDTKKKIVKKRKIVPGIKTVEVGEKSTEKDEKAKIRDINRVKRNVKENHLSGSGITTRLKIRVLKKQRKIPISARFKIDLKDSPDPNKKPLRSITRRSSRYGWLFVAPKDDVNWIEIKAVEKGYKTASKLVKVERGKDTRVLVELTPVLARKMMKNPVYNNNQSEKESEFLFKPIYFSSNSTQIKLENYPVIHNLINYMRRNKSVNLEITGYADRFGAHKKNKRISYLRAKTVRDYMTKFGLRRKRFSIKGVGNNRSAVYTRKTRYSDYNRRVEFRIISGI